MLRRILHKVLHSLEHSRHGSHRRHSSSAHRGHPTGHYGNRYSSSDRPRSGGHGHGYYKNRYSSSS
ncbi:hypothetical protein F4V43_13900 [Paenibacillus spiritus]|uniref:Uncharacterized protein n=1 Tax=Paenibacillus spiritus TaxID=2496557 RepID=A0A5J5G3M4_9BACL|nr:hypothetical protein [Paenibacillus spiritus]KAA9001610.1 hypothetical protein F4V43_13900 [Paenibacillus spiritus]